ncbi:unnamed protein product [Mytilus coruscus]|uniref:Ig-like domain-containing protein n=1 Tax=Mytilus coruscus TaxID=42192 RepID=A0A6J8C8C3_MYTCO|nr:unnamed protein product [Mytilus coruscus]
MLIADIIDKFTNSTNCFNLLNKFGICVCKQTYERYQTQIVEERKSNSMNSSKCQFQIASVDNINKRSSYSAVKSTDAHRGFDGTSIQLVISKPSIKLLPEEKQQYLKGNIYLYAGIIKKFEEGAFVVNISGRNIQSQGLDEAHESCINREVKGAMRTFSSAASSKLVHYLPHRTKVLSNLNKELLFNNQDLHKTAVTRTTFEEENILLFNIMKISIISSKLSLIQYIKMECLLWFIFSTSIVLTDVQSRSSHTESDIDEAIMVFKLDSDYLLDTDNSVYKCEIDSESYTGTQWNTANIDWTGCVDEHAESESICTKSSLLSTLVAFLTESFRTEICLASNINGFVCPPSLKKDLFTTAAVDNTDHNPVAAILFDILFLSFTLYISNGLKGEFDHISELIVIDTACAISAAILTPIAYILFLKDYIEDCKCCKKNTIRPMIITLPKPPAVHDPANTITVTKTEIQYVAGGSTIMKNGEGFADANASIKQVKFKQTTLSVLKAECKSQDDEGVQRQDVEIQFSKRNCSVSCKLNMPQSKTIYWIKLQKEINGSFYDIVHKRLRDQIYVIHWFYCTDTKSRFSVNESNLDEPRLRLFSNDVRDSDSGTYKCVVNSGDIYWNKMTIKFGGCPNDNTIAKSICTKPVLLYIIISLLFIMIL